MRVEQLLDERDAGPDPRQGTAVPVAAVVFDLDGVLIDSEPIWSEVRHDFALAHGGIWVEEADSRMMGMATLEWAEYMHDDLKVSVPVDTIAERVIEGMMARYRAGLPLLPEAVETVHRIANRWTLGLASSSPARLIAVVLESADLVDRFSVTMSTEEIGVGKPAPDIYLEVARRLNVAPQWCAAIEDSTNGVWSALGAGMRVIAVPRRSAPVDPDVLARADVVIERLADVTPETIDAL